MGAKALLQPECLIQKGGTLFGSLLNCMNCKADNLHGKIAYNEAQPESRKSPCNGHVMRSKKLIEMESECTEMQMDGHVFYTWTSILEDFAL